VTRRRLPDGWTQGSVRDLLGLTDEEAILVEIRVRLSENVREMRRAKRLTQRQLAERIGSTQPRVAMLERAGASIEMLLRALLALGASRREIARLLAA
jgi:predicted XRE-type DNA-binding protein